MKKLKKNIHIFFSKMYTIILFIYFKSKFIIKENYLNFLSLRKIISSRLNVLIFVPSSLWRNFICTIDSSKRYKSDFFQIYF